MLGNEFNTLKTDKQQQKRIKHLSCLFFFLSFFLPFFFSFGYAAWIARRSNQSILKEINPEYSQV